MDIIIRPIRPEETGRAARLGMRSFAGIESLFVGRPRDALVAEADGELAGVVSVKQFSAGRRGSVGYLDVGFVGREHRGSGIGGKLYRASIDWLWERGCTVQAALVKGDNVASWGLLERNGFRRAGLRAAWRVLGPAGLAGLLLRTPCLIADGMDLYLAAKDGLPQREGSGRTAFLWYLLLNLAILLGLYVWPRGSAALPAAGAFLTLLLIGPLLGRRGAGSGWRFRLHGCGCAVTMLLMAMGTVFPLLGIWYPERYEKTAAFRRELARGALWEWAALLAVCAASFWLRDGAYFAYLYRFSSQLLLFRVLAFYPFEGFGGVRVRQWSPGIFLVLALASVALAVML